MCFIFHLSDQPAVISAETSRTLSQKILEAVRENPTPQMIRSFDAFLRNSAHFGMFYILGLSAFITFSLHALKYPFLISMLYGVSYAFTDEVHQIFVTGRAFQLRDLSLDSLGFFLGITTVAVVINLIKRQQQSREKQT
jgi:VanZ family protein